MKDTHRYILAGTGAPQIIANTYYAAIAKRATAQIIALPNIGLTAITAAIDYILETLCKDDTNIELLGHSQGGLIAALTAARRPQQINRVITIAAPLNGTLWCRLPALFPAMHTMHPSQCSYDPTHMVNIVGLHDKIIIPWHSGLVPGATHHIIPAGHISLINHPTVLKIISDLYIPQDIPNI